MDEEQPQPSSEESREEAALLKLQEEFRHLESLWKQSLYKRRP